MSSLSSFSCEEQQMIKDAQSRLLATRQIVAEWEQEHGVALGAEYEAYYDRRIKELSKHE